MTVTRVAGSSGRVTVDYTTTDIPTNSPLMGTNGFLINGDLPASSTYTYQVGARMGMRLIEYVVAGLLSLPAARSRLMITR